MLLVWQYQQTEARQVIALSAGKDDGVRSENRLLLKLQIHRRMITWFPGPLAKWQLEEWSGLLVQASQVQLFTVANQRSGEDIFYYRSQCEELPRNGLKQLKRCLVSRHCRHEKFRLYQAWPTANQRKAPAIHETHNQYNKLPKLTPMDLSRMKAEKDARDGQDLAMARQRQSEQVRQNILMREQTQRVATIPVRNLLLSIGPMLMVSQTAPAQQPQQSTSQSQPQQAQQVQQPLTQQQLQHQHTQIPQLHQIQAQQQAIQSQRSTGAPSTIPNRSARLSTAVNARPLSQQGQHLQQGRGVQVSVPLQTGAQANMVSFPILNVLYLSMDY